MRDTSELTSIERHANQVLYRTHEEDRDELARLALVVDIARRDNISRNGQKELDDVLRRVCPEMLLALQALRQINTRLHRNTHYLYRRRSSDGT